MNKKQSRREKQLAKATVINSYAKSSKKWSHFGWFVLGIVLLAGIGYATTVNDVQGFIGNGEYIQNASPMIVFTTDGKGDYSCLPSEDCAVKINSAIQSLGATGGRIYFRNGVYNIDSMIKINWSGIYIEGESRGGMNIESITYGLPYYNQLEGITALNQTSTFPAGKPLINVTGSSVNIENIVLLGRDKTSYTPAYVDGEDAIVLAQGFNNYVRGVNIEGFKDTAIVAPSQGSTTGAGFGNGLVDIRISRMGKDGIYIVKHDYHLVNIEIAETLNGASLNLQKGSGIQVQNFHSWHNQYGIILNGTTDSQFNGVTLEGNNLSAVFITADSATVENNVFSAMTFYLNNRYSTNNSRSTVFFFNINSANNIERQVINGITVNDWTSTAPVFNYSDTGAGSITRSLASNIVYGSGGIGTIPSGLIVENDVKNIINSKGEINTGGLDTALLTLLTSATQDGILVKGRQGVNNAFLEADNNGTITDTNVRWVHSMRSDNQDYWIYAYNGSSFPTFVKFDYSQKLTELPQSFLKLTANTTAVTCNAGNAGTIYYDGSQGSHFACNTTAWQRMY